MSLWLIVLTGIIYGAIAVDQAMRGNWPLVIVMGSYALSSIGYWMMIK